jgi:hypothetical protein
VEVVSFYPNVYSTKEPIWKSILFATNGVGIVPTLSARLLGAHDIVLVDGSVIRDPNTLLNRIGWVLREQEGPCTIKMMFCVTDTSNSQKCPDWVAVCCMQLPISELDKLNVDRSAAELTEVMSQGREPISERWTRTPCQYSKFEVQI